jgi:hypothetical protein
MHGLPYPSKTKLCYKCGTYTKTCGVQCDHNWVAQDDLLTDVLLTIRSAVIPHQAELRAAIDEVIKSEPARRSDAGRLTKKQHERQKVVVASALNAVAAAQDEVERSGLREIYGREREELVALEKDMAAISPTTVRPLNNLVDLAMKELDLLNERLVYTNDLQDLSALFKAINLRVWSSPRNGALEPSTSWPVGCFA